MKEYPLPKSRCPNCNYEMDRTTSIDHDASPEPGNITICINCTSLLTFKDDMTLETFDFSKLDQKAKDYILGIQRLILKVKRKEVMQ